MEQNLQQNTNPEAVPWTISDIAKGAMVAIGITIVLAIIIAICMVALIGITDLQDISQQNLTQTEMMQKMLDAIEANGRLNIAMIILFGLMLLGEAAIPLGAWLFSIRKYRCKWGSLGFVKFDVRKGLLLAILVTCIGLGISIGYEVLLERMGREISTDLYAFFTANNIGIALFAVTAVIVAPFAEETFFRGFMFQGIRKRIGFAWAAIISAALFALAHLSTESMIPIFLLGLMLAWLYHTTKSVWPCIIVHAAYNSIGVISMIKS